MDGKFGSLVPTRVAVPAELPARNDNQFRSMLSPTQCAAMDFVVRSPDSQHTMPQTTSHDYSPRSIHKIYAIAHAPRIFNNKRS